MRSVKKKDESKGGYGMCWLDVCRPVMGHFQKLVFDFLLEKEKKGGLYLKENGECLRR